MVDPRTSLVPRPVSLGQTQDENEGGSISLLWDEEHFPIPEPSLEAYCDESHFISNSNIEQDYGFFSSFIDTSAAASVSQQSVIVGASSSAVVARSPPLHFITPQEPAPTLLATTTKSPSDALVPRDPFNFSEAFSPSFPLVVDNQNTSDNDWAYFCFSDAGWLTNEVRGPVPIAPKPTTMQQGAIAAALPQTTGLNSTIEPLSKKKRKRFDEDDRAKVKKVRKIGACFRCKIYKLPCNEELPCANCLKVKDTQKVYRGPCIRANVEEVHAFRAGDGDNGTVRAILPTFQWPHSGSMKTVKLQWPFRINSTNAPILTIACQEFKPNKETLTEEYVVNGLVRKVELPPWACRDTSVARQDIERFMTACQSLLEDEIRDTLEEPILLLTWNEAKRYRMTYRTPLITSALQIYAGAMMNSKYPTSAEANVFGVADETHTPYFFEKLPLPPQLTYQIQTMVGQAMLDIQTKTLKELKKRVFAKDRARHWYEVFLTIFILLASIEWVYQVQIRFLKAKQGVSTRNFTNISYVTQYMFDEWEASAFNLIGHFRCVMNGEVPFAQSWDEGEDNPRRTGLDDEALKFIRNIKQETESRREELQDLRKAQGKLRFEKPLAAICELFLPA